MREQGPEILLRPPAASAEDAMIAERNVLRLWIIARVLWADRWIVLGALIVAVAGWMAYEARWGDPPRYRSTARLYVRQAQTGMFADALGLGSAGGGAAVTQATLLSSESVLGEALKDPAVDSLAALKGTTDRLAVIKRTIEVSPGKADGVLQVSAALRDPTESARLVNAVVDAFIGFHATLRRARADELRRVLAEEKQRIEQEMQRQRTQMLERLNGPAGDDGGEAATAIVVSRLEAMSGALTQLRMQLIEMRSRRAALVEAGDDPEAVRHAATVHGIPAAITGGEEERASLAAARNQRAAAEQRYGPRSPVIGELDRRIEEAAARVRAHEAAAAKLTRQFLDERIAALQRQEADMLAAFDDAQSEARRLSVSADDLATLRKAADRTERFHEAMIERIDRLDLADAAPEMTIAVLDRATPATGAIPGSGRKRLAGALCVAIGLALVVVAIKSIVQRRLYTDDQLADELGAPVVGAVPRIAGVLSDEQRGRYVLTHPASEAAEAYRAVRTALLFGPAERGGLTLTVTSPNHGVGKSTVAANLAIAVALSGRRTLLLDADFHQPRHHRYFAVPAAPTLADLFQAEAPARLDDTIRRTDVPALDVLTCAEPGAGPGDLLTSRAFANVLAHLRERYDVIVIDAVPILSITDAQVGAALADLTLVVVAPQMLARTVRQTRRTLDAVGARVFGAVVNGVGRWGLVSDCFGSHGDALARSAARGRDAA